MKLVIALVLLMQSNLLWARAFETITIPGAKCGNGSDYKVFLSKKHEEKLLVEFMGGGACWDKSSCFEIPHTLIRPIPNIEIFSTLTSDDKKLNPFINHSILYFPYCTGDVHLGNHTANYEGKTVYHWGRINFLMAIKYLAEQKILSLKNFNDVTVWGASAGAIATMIHAKEIGKHLPDGAKKTMIPDSPGLHFGKNFWDKFPAKTKKDFSDAFKTVNLDVDFNDGFVARGLRSSFDDYKDWNMGFLVASKDAVMSSVFGDISPNKQEKLVLGPAGLPAIAREYSNIQVWLKDTHMHTFLLVGPSAEMESNLGETASNFVKRVYRTGR